MIFAKKLEKIDPNLYNTISLGYANFNNFASTLVDLNKKPSKGNLKKDSNYGGL